MVSTRQPSQTEQVASNVWLRADGGCIFADAPNAVTSAAVIVHHISMHRNIAPRRVTRSSPASSRASTGFTTIVPNNSSPGRSFPLLTAIRWINRCRDRPGRCLQTGKRCFTNRARAAICRAIRLPRNRHERHRDEADMNRPARLDGSVENDPYRRITRRLRCSAADAERPL